MVIIWSLDVVSEDWKGEKSGRRIEVRWGSDEGSEDRKSEKVDVGQRLDGVRMERMEDREWKWITFQAMA